MMKRFVNNKKGTAEVVGSVMFIIILLFFFTNVYLWHDTAVKEMNNLQIKRMNAGMEVIFVDGTATITATGSEVVLSRIWIITNDNQHAYADLESLKIHLIAGKATPLIFVADGSISNGIIQAGGNADGITLHYPYPVATIKKISVLNTLGVVV
jgi:hypothetical protein